MERAITTQEIDHQMVLAYEAWYREQKVVVYEMQVFMTPEERQAKCRQGRKKAELMAYYHNAEYERALAREKVVDERNRRARIDDEARTSDDPRWKERQFRERQRERSEAATNDPYCRVRLAAGSGWGEECKREKPCRYHGHRENPDLPTEQPEDDGKCGHKPGTYKWDCMVCEGYCKDPDCESGYGRHSHGKHNKGDCTIQ